MKLRIWHLTLHTPDGDRLDSLIIGWNLLPVLSAVKDIQTRLPGTLAYLRTA